MRQEYEDFQNYGDPNKPPRREPQYSVEDWENQLDAQLRAAGRAIDEGMSYGFEQMNRVFQDMDCWGRVGDRLRFAAEQVQSSLDRAQMYSGKNVFIHSDAEERQARPDAGSANRALQRAARKHQLLGGIECFFGGSMTFAFGISFFVLIEWMPGLSSAFLLTTFASLIPLLFGVKNLRFANFVRTLLRAAGQETVLPLEYLAEDMQMKPKKLRARLNRYTRSGWLPAWLNRDKSVLYLDQESWRAAREEAAQAAEPSQTEPQPEPQKTTEKDPLAQLRSFVDILSRESSMMADDPQAVQELEQLTETSRKILEWADKHPESLPKLRHLNEQYVPMTLKLLYTYNDLKMQDSDNAVHVRQDIAGMLHALNQGFSTLLDQLLDAVAMDVTGDIAALQGMLAWDGLTENPMFHE